MSACFTGNADWWVSTGNADSADAERHAGLGMEMGTLGMTGNVFGFRIGARSTAECSRIRNECLPNS